MNNEIVLYDYEGSPCARRVKIFLIEKGIKFRTQPINLSKMEQKSPDYLRVNPNGLVPAINHNGRIIFESSVINDYLEDNFPKVSLIPQTSAGIIEAKQWESYELSMANTYRPLMYARTMGPLHRVACTLEEFLYISSQATDNTAYLNWQEKVWNLQVLSPTQQMQHRKKLGQFIDLVERRLENKKYLVENRFTSADISVYPRLTMLPLVGVDINAYSYPNVSAWIARISKRHSIQSTYSDAEKGLVKLGAIGLTGAINRMLYKEEPLSFYDKVFMGVLRPILRKKLGIAESLLARQNKNLTISVAAENKSVVSADSRAIKMPEVLKNEPLMFYGYSGSPVCDRIVMLCKLLDIDYTPIEIDMAVMEHKKPPYQYLNPAEELPLLLHGDTIVHDSLFIAEYLCSSRTSSLFSTDSYEQAQIRMWNAFDMGMRKEYQPIFLAHINNAEIVDSEKQNGLTVLSAKMCYLDSCLINKDFLVGNRLTYADIAVYSRIATFSLMGLDVSLENRTEIERWTRHVQEALSIKKSKAVLPKKRKSKRKQAAHTLIDQT